LEVKGVEAELRAPTRPEGGGQEGGEMTVTDIDRAARHPVVGPEPGRAENFSREEVALRSLMAQAFGGEAWAWAQLVERFDPMIQAIARRHRLAPADAAEVSQTTWLRLIEGISHVEHPERVGGWLATTARRECLRVLRALDRQVPVGDGSALDGVDPQASPVETRTLAAERDTALHRACHELPPRCRLLLGLLMAEPRPSYQELAQALETRIGSIGPTRGRCLEHLRQLAMELGLTSS
jgi:RNA polymerase sigma factor (sigma-70 family)